MLPELLINLLIIEADTANVIPFLKTELFSTKKALRVFPSACRTE
jgi:hypothetical protein